MIEVVLWAIWQVEASGKLKPKDGDGGKSIGPYQIQRAYHDDAVAEWISKANTYAKPDYRRCRELAYSRDIVCWYAWRYSRGEYGTLTDITAPRGKQWKAAEIIARRHNGGGPKGDTKKATLPYWAKVRTQMELYLAKQAKEAKP